MEKIVEDESFQPPSLASEMGDCKNKRKFGAGPLFGRAQSLKAQPNNNADGPPDHGGNSNKTPNKPQRSASSSSSSTAVRIQVTFHRPLTWQVSSASSSSIPKKSIRREAGLDPPRPRVTFNNLVNVKLNGNHIGTVQPPEDENEDFTFDIPIQTCEIARWNHRNSRTRARRNDSNQHSSSSDPDREAESRRERRRKRSGKTQRRRPVSPEEENPEVPLVKVSSDSRKSQPVVLAAEDGLGQENLGFHFPDRERHVCGGLHPVMTWFREPRPHVNTQDQEGEMGANGSTCNNHHGGRLKSRSQSSSALYGVKPTVNNNGVNSHSSQQQVYYTEEVPYYNINANSPKRNYHYAHQGRNGLSSSIPADLWDCPPNSKSYSPVRLQNQKQARSHHQLVEPSRKQHRIIQMPAVEALITRTKKGGRKGSTGRGPIPEPHTISNRAKLYAVSCPDVARNLDQDDYDSRDDSVQVPGHCDGKAAHQHEHRTHHGSHRTQQKTWTEKQNRRSSEDPSLSHQDMKCSFPIPAFPFITQDSIFEVFLRRDHRGLGLGLSVTGGADSQESYPGLIRVKKVFPMGPAFQSGRLRPWDIILKANGVPLTGLTNHEALEVLRTTPTDTVLVLCRLPPTHIPQLYGPPEGKSSEGSSSKSHPESRLTNQPRLSHHESIDTQAPSGHWNRGYREDSFTSASFSPSIKSKSLSSLKIPPQYKNYGEFEITLEKIGGSLGFTLRQEDSSILGHYVRALVKDPALSDGRIQPGDRILSVNGKALEGMSHADAIGFLRQCPAVVHLRFYRDPAPTPVSPLSPTESQKSIKEKTYRQEAIDMLNDLALRKQMSGSSEPKYSLPGSSASRTSGGLRGHGKVDANGPATLPRRRPGHAGMTPSPEVLSAALDRFAGRSTTPKSNRSPEPPRPVPNSKDARPNYPSETRSSGSGESTPASGTISQTRKGKLDLDKEDGESLGNRKPSFRQYTMHLDRISSFEDESFSSDLNQNDSIVSAPGFGSSPTGGNKFRPGQPAYQSAIVPSTREKTRSKKNLSLTREEMEKYGHCGQSSRGGSDSFAGLSDIDIPPPSTSTPLPTAATSNNQQSGRNDGSVSKSSPSAQRRMNEDSASSSSRLLSSGGLVKWKGILFSAEDDDADYDEDDDEDNLDSLDGSLPQRHPVLGESDGGGPPSSNVSSSTTLSKQSSLLQVQSGELPRRQSPDGREFREGDGAMIEVSSSKELFNGEQVLTVQLSRRWCSRLGFSIQGSDGHTFITAIYPDSVAGRDGRLHVGDEVIMVNNETIRNMETSEVIDLMRKTRGTISITLLRKPSGAEDEDAERDSSDSQLGLT